MATKGGSGVFRTDFNGGPEMLIKALKGLASNEVLVGFPAATTDRREDPEDAASKDLTNAELGYIHDNGAPEANIPARPFMIPGIEAARSKLVRIARRTGLKTLEATNPAEVVDQGLHAMGLVAQSSIRQVINDGIDPPLADRTLRERARRGRKGAKEELENRAKGLPQGKELAKPLIDTGQLRNAVNYVIRPRKTRRK
jgi:hypothetical protein